MRVAHGGAHRGGGMIRNDQGARMEWASEFDEADEVILYRS